MNKQVLYLWCLLMSILFSMANSAFAAKPAESDFVFVYHSCSRYNQDKYGTYHFAEAVNVKDAIQLGLQEGAVYVRGADNELTCLQLSNQVKQCKDKKCIIFVTLADGVIVFFKKGLVLVSDDGNSQCGVAYFCVESNGGKKSDKTDSPLSFLFQEPAETPTNNYEDLIQGVLADINYTLVTAD